MLFFKIITILIGVLISYDSFSQEVVLYNFDNEIDTISIYTFNGKKAILSQQFTQREFKYTNPIKESSYIRIQTEKNYKDLILSPKEDSVKVFFDNLGNIHIKNSKENSLLNEFINRYKSLNKLGYKDSLKSFCNDFLAKHKSYYFAETIRIRLAGFLLDNNLTFVQKKNHFFDNVNFNNPDLLNGSVIPDIYMKYFEQFVNYDEVGFKEAIKTILEKSSVNESFYNFSLEFLMELFGEVGPKVIFEHLVNEYYQTNSCSINMDNEQLLAQIKQITSLQEGSKFPNISIQKNISEIYSIHKNTIVIFWSSHCPFCKNLINYLHKRYDILSENNIEVVAVALDENLENYKNSTQYFSWVNYCDFKGWDSPLVKQLYITKTPSVFIINTDGVIIKKNINEKNIEKEVTKLINRVK